jgi:hypothetical protein
MTDLSQIQATLQSKVSEPILNYGFYMARGSFTKLAPGVTTGIGKMLGGLKRKKNAGDLSGTSTSKAMWGLDNHQTALCLTNTMIYAIDTQTGMDRQMRVGEVLDAWPLSEVTISGHASSKGKDLMLVNLDLEHVPSGKKGELETMVYTNLGDPSWDCYQALVRLGGG